MAIDRLINSTQGDSIIAALGSSGSIAQSLAIIAAKSNTPYNSDNKLNPSFIAYDTTHAAVTEAQRTQIGTNTTNITWNTNNGVKNVIPLKSSVDTGNANVTFTQNADKSYTLTISATTSTNVGFDISEAFTMDSNIQYVLSGNSSSGAVRLVIAEATSPYSWVEQQYNSTPVNLTPVANKVYKLMIYVYANTAATTLTIKPMICPKSLYDADQTYQPNALSNAELTVKELVNEKNISSIYTQNGRSYNILDLNDVALMASSITHSFDNATGSVIASCATATYKRIVWNLPITTGIRYRIDFDVTSFNSSMMLYPTKTTAASSAPYGQVDITAAGHYSLEFTPDVDTLYVCLYLVTEPANSNSITIRNFKIIPKSAYDAGFNEFVPYALSNTTITPALKECVNNGVKNLVDVPDITISASGGGYVTVNNNVVLPAGKYVIILKATATSGGILTSFKDSGGNTIGSLELTMNGGQIKGTIFLSAQSSYFNAFANQPTTVTKYMIIAEAMYDAGFTDYQPYALSNAELTNSISTKISLRDILGYGTVIPAGTTEAPQDLNNYASMGVFTIENTATAGTISNMPVTFPGRLFVLAGAVAGANIQVYLTGENLYIRRKSASNIWSAWVSMV